VLSENNEKNHVKHVKVAHVQSSRLCTASISCSKRKEKKRKKKKKKKKLSLVFRNSPHLQCDRTFARAMRRPTQPRHVFCTVMAAFRSTARACRSSHPRQTLCPIVQLFTDRALFWIKSKRVASRVPGYGQQQYVPGQLPVMQQQERHGIVPQSGT
jgi:hypothetical protein